MKEHPSKDKSHGGLDQREIQGRAASTVLSKTAVKLKNIRKNSRPSDLAVRRLSVVLMRAGSVGCMGRNPDWSRED